VVRGLPTYIIGGSGLLVVGAEEVFFFFSLCFGSVLDLFVVGLGIRTDSFDLEVLDDEDVVVVVAFLAFFKGGFLISSL
jgi:hypothetical protein